MGILAGDNAESAERRRNGVAAPLHCQAKDVFRIEVVGIFGKRGPCAMFNPLIDRKNREIARIG